MAKYVLRDGERELERAWAQNTREPLVGDLVLTNQRVVLLGKLHKQELLDAVPVLGPLFKAIFRPLERIPMTDEIPRADFAGAEVTSPKRLAVRSKRPGYSFEVTIQKPEAWAARLAAWVNGEEPPVPPPGARVVKGG